MALTINTHGKLQQKLLQDVPRNDFSELLASASLKLRYSASAFRSTFSFIRQSSIKKMVND
jgi:hypothetical protein